MRSLRGFVSFYEPLNAKPAEKIKKRIAALRVFGGETL